jgi:hypothetical protein
VTVRRAWSTGPSVPCAGPPAVDRTSVSPLSASVHDSGTDTGTPNAVLSGPVVAHAGATLAATGPTASVSGMNPYAKPPAFSYRTSQRMCRPSASGGTLRVAPVSANDV